MPTYILKNNSGPYLQMTAHSIGSTPTEVVSLNPADEWMVGYVNDLVASQPDVSVGALVAKLWGSYPTDDEELETIGAEPEAEVPIGDDREDFIGSVVETYALKRQASPASPSWTVDGVQYATRKAANRALATMLGNYTPEEWEAAQHAHGLNVGEPEGTTNPWPTGSTAQALSEPAVAVYDPSVDTLGFYPAGGAGHLEVQVEVSTSQRAIYRDEMPMALLVGAVRFESGFNVVMTPSAEDRTFLVSLGAASVCARLWDNWTRLAVPSFEVIRFEANWRVTVAALPGDDGLEELLARARANNRRRRQRPQPGES